MLIALLNIQKSLETNTRNEQKCREINNNQNMMNI